MTAHHPAPRRAPAACTLSTQLDSAASASPAGLVDHRARRAAAIRATILGQIGFGGHRRPAPAGLSGGRGQRAGSAQLLHHYAANPDAAEQDQVIPRPTARGRSIHDISRQVPTTKGTVF